MTYTLADAIRDEFERTHPRGKNTLLCVGLCRRRKDRECFPETPWHGRAAECRNCARHTWRDALADRDRWLLEQERAKVRMYARYVRRLKSQRLMEATGLVASITTPEEWPQRNRKRARLTIQMERKR